MINVLQNLLVRMMLSMTPTVQKERNNVLISISHVLIRHVRMMTMIGDNHGQII